jgi:hypothetical protein
VATDGIIDPQALAGTPATADEPFDRISTAAVSYRAARAADAPPAGRGCRSRCTFADANTPADPTGCPREWAAHWNG